MSVIQLRGWFVLTIQFSLSTINREYAALMGLPHYDLCPAILHPALPPIPTPKEEDIKKVMTVYRVNEPQAIAISSCLATSGFSLIQGLVLYLGRRTVAYMISGHREQERQAP